MHRIKIILITLACFLLPYNVQAKDLTTLENIPSPPIIKTVSNVADKVFWDNSNAALITTQNSSKLYDTQLGEPELDKPKVSEAKKIFDQRRALVEKRAKLRKTLGTHPPHVIITLYPRWFFVTGGIIRGIFYYYVHFYAALFLLWSGLKMAARMDFVFIPVVSWLDWAVRPLLLMSTKFLPFTGASGISAQIFLLIVSATGKFIRQFVWLIYDTEIDYIIREKRHFADKGVYLPENLYFQSRPSIEEILKSEEVPRGTTFTTGYEKFNQVNDPPTGPNKIDPWSITPRSTISQADYAGMEKLTNENAEIDGYRLIEPSLKWLQYMKFHLGRILHLNDSTYIKASAVSKLYDGSLGLPDQNTDKELWVRQTDPNFAPGGKFSILNEHKELILNPKDLHTFEDFPFLGLYEKVPQLPRLRVLEYHEFIQYADNLGTTVIKYPEIKFWWKTPTETNAMEWGGYVFNRAVTYWPEASGKWSTLAPGLTNWLLRDEARIDEALYRLAST